MRVALAALPLDVRVAAAQKLVAAGELEPLDALGMAVWPPERYFDHRIVASIVDREVDRCRNGHPWTKRTLYLRPDGQRECLACRNERAFRWRRDSRKSRSRSSS